MKFGTPAFKALALFAVTGAGLLPVAAQQNYQPYVRINPGPGIIMEGGAQMYDLSRQRQELREWQERQRQMWILDQQRKQQWIQQQNQLRYMQQQQRYVQPYPNSTPMFRPAVPQQYQQQQVQQWQQQYKSRQNTLQRWNMQPLPPRRY
jgi:hypothetical protein